MKIILKILVIASIAGLSACESIENLKDINSIDDILPADEQDIASPAVTYFCKKTGQPVKLDGKLDDPAWQSADVLWDFFRYPMCKWDSQEIVQNSAESRRDAAASPTEVKMLWDDKYLYLGAKIYDQDIFSGGSDDDTNLAEGDILELFLRPDLKSKGYYEFQVAPNNTKTDVFYHRRNAGGFRRGVSFNSGMKTAVSIEGTLRNWKDKDKYWIVEMRIPFAGLKPTGGKAPRPDERWMFAVCRYEHSVYLPNDFFAGMEMSSSADDLVLYKFHHYERYDYLKFVDESLKKAVEPEHPEASPKK